jgi:hypothetical protein
VESQDYQVKPYGKQSIRVWGALVNGVPQVAATIPDNIFISTVSMSTPDARRFAAAIIDACDRAERAAAGLEKS